MVATSPAQAESGSKWDRTIYTLLCCYVFLVPLEQVLDVLFGIDTIFKPYRVASLVMVGAFAVKVVSESRIRKLDRADRALCLLFAYGILVSVFGMITTDFSLSLFYNKLFQTSIYLSAYFIAKQLKISEADLRRICLLLLAGVALNVMAVLSLTNLKNGLANGRDSGFFDNPNYLSIATVYATTYLLIHIVAKSWIRSLGYLLIVWASFTVLLLSGSRTGFGVMLGVALIIVLFQRWYVRLIIVVGLLVTGMSYVLFESDSFSLIENSATITRLQGRGPGEEPRLPVWEGVWRAAQENNFIGMGLGQFEAHFGEFYRGEWNDLIYRIRNYSYHLSTHSDYFSILITYGIPGLLLFLYFLFSNGLTSLARLLHATRPDVRRLRLLQFCCLLIAILFGFTAENFTSGLYWSLLSIATISTFDSP